MRRLTQLSTALGLLALSTLAAAAGPASVYDKNDRAL